jgi:hypothetical protein
MWKLENYVQEDKKTVTSYFKEGLHLPPGAKKHHDKFHPTFLEKSLHKYTN